MVSIQEKLELVRFKVDKQPHIRLKAEVCSSCEAKPCLWVCPAGLFTLSGGEVLFSYEGCLECGTCYLTCPEDAIEWSYPQGGYGVCFRES
jgi:ferredoxin like protein